MLELAIIIPAMQFTKLKLDKNRQCAQGHLLVIQLTSKLMEAWLQKWLLFHSPAS